ncbi:MAG: hydroxyacid dehydrogenase, partial [bacterium]
MKKKVLICDPIADEGVGMLKTRCAVAVRTGLSEQQLEKTIPGYNALVVRSSTKVTQRIIRAGASLEIIARAGIGIDNINVEAATRAGIVVVNSPLANTLAAAEHALSLLLALCRNIPQADRSVHEQRWDRKKFVGTEVTNKVLGVVGLGRIGSVVAAKARGLGMRVIATDPLVSEEHARKLGAELVSRNRLLKEADFITFHVPATRDTYHMISSREFARMKNGVRIINCGRGSVIDEKALLNAIRRGR